MGDVSLMMRCSSTICSKRTVRRFPCRRTAAGEAPDARRSRRQRRLVRMEKNDEGHALQTEAATVHSAGSASDGDGMIPGEGRSPMPPTKSPRRSSSWEARERLRATGQCWTPDGIAEPMADYVVGDRGALLFDPAVGTGAFFRAAKEVAREKGLPVRCAGMAIDPAMVALVRAQGWDLDDRVALEIGDGVGPPPSTQFPSIVANPPSIRPHRLSPEKNVQLKRRATHGVGKPLDGWAGVHIFFVIRALSLLEAHGRLACIMPADPCEGKLAPDRWDWITSHVALDAVPTFAPEATPFPTVDVNPLIFVLRKAPPNAQCRRAKGLRPATEALKRWGRSGFKTASEPDVWVMVRDVKEGGRTGRSREPFPHDNATYGAGDVVRGLRGRVTGWNDCFVMTVEKARRWGIPEASCVRAMGRTRDVPVHERTHEPMEILERQGRPTLLLALRGDPNEALPDPGRQDVQEGERLGAPNRPLIAQRTPWDPMECRAPPPCLWASVGRRNARWIRTTARVVPLNGFFWVYPNAHGEDHREQRWKILNHPDTGANSAKVGKTDGDGAVTVEPRF
ncbi:MAG: N-6 DNA methylase [Minisyncoccia bacterium]